MNEQREEIIEKVQEMIVKLLATNSAGRNLHLIGGYRFRLLDNSPRLSVDVDYHTAEDFEKKRDEVLSLLSKKLLPWMKDTYGYEGIARAAFGPNADTSLVKTVQLVFYIKDFAQSKIEIPVDLTSIEALDDPEPRTAGGVALLTRSDKDIIESKVIALLTSTFVRDRDILDIFLFEEKIDEDSAARLRQKMKNMKINNDGVDRRVKQLVKYKENHIRNITEIMKTQCDAKAVENINMGGGASSVFARVMEILNSKLGIVVGE